MSSESRSLQELAKWFPTGTAEGERDILPKVFIESDQLERIFSPPVGSPHLLIGKKGSGKSAIFEHVLHQMKTAGFPALLVRPMDIKSSEIGDNFSLGDITREFKSIIMSTMANILVERHSGLITGHLEVLYHEAIGVGLKSPSGIGKVARIVTALAKPITKVDFAALFPEANSRSQSDLRKALVKETARSQFFLFIDDTD